jgi:hypothetical protein
MSKYGRLSPSNESYELHPTQNTNPSEALDSTSEPLLPRYERHSPSNPSASPHTIHQINKRRNRVVPAIRCLLISLLILVPTFGLVGCYFGRGFMGKLRGWDRWEDVPDGVKIWLEGLEGMVPHPGAAHEVFPTE